VFATVRSALQFMHATTVHSHWWRQRRWCRHPHPGQHHGELTFATPPQRPGKPRQYQDFSCG